MQSTPAHACSPRGMDFNSTAHVCRPDHIISCTCDSVSPQNQTRIEPPLHSSDPHLPRPPPVRVRHRRPVVSSSLLPPQSAALVSSRARGWTISTAAPLMIRGELGFLRRTYRTYMIHLCGSSPAGDRRLTCFVSICLISRSRAWVPSSVQFCRSLSVYVDVRVGVWCA
jgi:hypothetical protein